MTGEKLSPFFAGISFEIAARAVSPDEFPELRVQKISDAEYQLIPYREDKETGVRAYQFQRVIDAVDGPSAVLEVEKLFSDLAGYVLVNANAYALDPAAFKGDDAPVSDNPPPPVRDEERPPRYHCQLTGIVPLTQEALARTWDNVYRGNPLTVKENRGSECLAVMEGIVLAINDTEADAKFRKSLGDTFPGLNVLSVTALPMGD